MKRLLTAALVFVVSAGLLPLSSGAVDRSPSRLRGAMLRAAETQPRFVPKAPDAVDEFVTVAELRPIHFAFDRAKVSNAERAALDADAAWLKAHSELPILIAGNADTRGTDAYNLDLAARRAEAVRNELVARGVRADRITLVTYGEGRPTCRAQTEPCWATNRNAFIMVRREGPQRP